jgi:hypothetical protein
LEEAAIGVFPPLDIILQSMSGEMGDTREQWNISSLLPILDMIVLLKLIEVTRLSDGEVSKGEKDSATTLRAHHAAVVVAGSREKMKWSKDIKSISSISYLFWQYSHNHKMNVSFLRLRGGRTNRPLSFEGDKIPITPALLLSCCDSKSSIISRNHSITGIISIPRMDGEITQLIVQNSDRKDTNTILGLQKA